MQQEFAEAACRMTDEIIGKLSLLLQFYRETTDDEIAFDRTRLAIATCLAELDLEILHPIFEQHPELKRKFFRE